MEDIGGSDSGSVIDFGHVHRFLLVLHIAGHHMRTATIVAAQVAQRFYSCDDERVLFVGELT